MCSAVLHRVDFCSPLRSMQAGAAHRLQGEGHVDGGEVARERERLGAQVRHDGAHVAHVDCAGSNDDRDGVVTIKVELQSVAQGGAGGQRLELEVHLEPAVLHIGKVLVAAPIPITYNHSFYDIGRILTQAVAHGVGAEN
jgi:hypothetical protein